jgi:citrate lyase subunit beta/citryl-CoA lyase
MRSVLFVPAIVERFVERAPESGADVICLDLEDSVPPEEKVAARTKAADAIGNMTRSEYLTYVRVNGLATGLLEDDLLAVVKPGLDGIMLPKANAAEMIRRVDNYLAILERERGMEDGSLGVMPLIETAEGIVKSHDICSASPRVMAAALGAEDLAADMGVRRTSEGEEVQWSRAQMAVSAHAAGVAPIDTPDPDYTDVARLERVGEKARVLGYEGKLCIHPKQVEVCNRLFSPSGEEAEEARAIVERFEREGIAKGRAAIAADGRMIDTPMYRRAKRVVELAKRRR